MNPKGPVVVLDLFPVERAKLIEILDSLLPEQWHAPTSCAGWSVKDVAGHILGDDLNNLAGGRDRYSNAWFEGASWADLVGFINERNETWVAAMRRLSPAVLLEMLAFSGGRVQSFFRGLDPMSEGPNVAWAGAGPMPMWLHIAREYTERWLHQMHIREAVGALPLYEPDLFRPLLATFVHSLPVAYSRVIAPLSTHVVVEITGECGGRWSLVRGGQGWELYEGSAGKPRALVKLDGNTAWRLWTRGLDEEKARDLVEIEGDQTLGEAALRAVAIIA